MCRICIAVGLFLSVALVSTVWSQETGFLKRRIEVGVGNFIYQVYVPENWCADSKWPVILFLHGAGERGSDGEEQAKIGVGSAIRRDPSRFPAVVVMPQCQRGVMWNDPLIEKMVWTALEKSIEEFNGDRERLYLTGLSMGGYATFYFGAKYPGKFAAMVAVCGGVVPPRELRTDDPAGFRTRYLEAAAKIGKTPIWLFHGTEDNKVPVSESRRMSEALEQVGGDVRYTEYEGVGHNSWDRAYSEAELLPWILEKRR